VSASSPEGDSVFLAAGERFIPTEHARGPWDPGALHGGAPAALLTSAFERMQPGAELRIARLGFEFLRPVPLAPLKLSTRIVRPGRRVQELAGELSVLVDAPGGAEGGKDDGAPVEQVVCRASALRVRAIPGEVPATPQGEEGECGDAGEAGEAGEAARLGTPETARPLRFALDDDPDGQASFATSAMEMRSLGDPRRPGPGSVWMRLCRPLLGGEQASSLARLAATADFANGIGAALPFDRFLFINADLTIHLQRQPRGEWIGMDARTLLPASGTGLAESVLHDEHGPVGRAFQTLVVEPR
jgi:hypothetical protein